MTTERPSEWDALAPRHEGKWVRPEQGRNYLLLPSGARLRLKATRLDWCSVCQREVPLAVLEDGSTYHRPDENGPERTTP